MITYLHVPQHLGWGGDATVLTTCTHGGCSATHGVGGWCYRSCNLHTWSMFRNNWGGGVMLPFLQLAHMVDVPQHMGWGGDVTVLTTCTHGGCSATHGVGGWCYRSYNLHTWWMFRNTWGGGVMLPFLQLAHMVDVPQHMGWGGDVTGLTTCTHGGCSATTGVGGWCYRSYNLHTWWMFRNTWGGGVMLPFLQLAHMVDVPQHMGWGGDVTVLATCTHGRCSATTGVGGWQLQQKLPEEEKGKETFRRPCIRTLDLLFP